MSELVRCTMSREGLTVGKMYEVKQSPNERNVWRVVADDDGSYRSIAKRYFTAAFYEGGADTCTEDVSPAQAEFDFGEDKEETVAESCKDLRQYRYIPDTF